MSCVLFVIFLDFMNLVLLEPAEVEEGHARISAPDRRYIHCTTVLKVVEGSIVRVGVIGGAMFDATVAQVGELEIEFQLSVERQELASSNLNLSLVLALPRPRVLDRLWPVFAQLGFRRVMLVNAARVEKFYFNTHVLEEANFRPRLIKGLEQAAASTRIPEIGPEGGWLDFELDLLRQHAFTPLACSSRTFSTEVAIVALASAIATHRGLL